MLRVIIWRVEVFEQEAAEQSRARHGKVQWRCCEREECTLATGLREIEREHVDHGRVDRLSYGYDQDEDEEAWKVHAEEHWHGTKRSDGRAE